MQPGSSAIAATFALLAASACSAAPEAGCPPELNPLVCRGPLNIAHRGGAALAPESTMPAFANAVAMGADVLETDVHATSDGRVVCIHDEHVQRTTDGAGAVSSLSSSELTALDAGYNFSPDGGTTFPFRGAGVRIPTLEAVLAAFPEMLFSIEIKQVEPSIVDAVRSIIDRQGLNDRVVVASFSDVVMDELRREAPGLLTTLTLSEMLELSFLQPRDEERYEAPALVVQAPLAAVTEASIALAHRHGLIAQAWTVNDRATMDELLASGIDGIITDDPGLLRQAIAERTHLAGSVSRAASPP